MNVISLDTCIMQNDLIEKANKVVLEAQIKLKEKLLIFNSRKETERHNSMSKLNGNGDNCKKS